MKKILALALAAVALFCCLTACDLFEHKPGYDESLKCEKYENCAVFTFDDFPIRETASFELERTGLGEGAIYYQVNLEEGALSVSYKDTIINTIQPLGEFTTDDEMPINGSGGYVEGDKISITFESYSPVSGEIIIAFTENALKAVHKDIQLHKHTYEYETREDAHKKIYTCDCTNLEKRDFESHYDEDNNGECDECEYEIEHEHISGEWQYDENYHWVSHITCTWGACDVDPGIFGHSDRNGDGKCDECNYQLKSNWYQNNLIEDGNIVKVTVSSVPVGYEYSYTGDDATAIVDYVKNLNLITAFEENPDEYSGMTWRIFLEYDDGYSTYVLHFGNMFIRSELGSWCKMNPDEASQFDTLLSELNND